MYTFLSHRLLLLLPSFYIFFLHIRVALGFSRHRCYFICGPVYFYLFIYIFPCHFSFCVSCVEALAPYENESLRTAAAHTQYYIFTHAFMHNEKMIEKNTHRDKNFEREITFAFIIIICADAGIRFRRSFRR